LDPWRENRLRGRLTGLPRHDDEGVDAMGRGRQKAKQTKVARELKYYSPATDYASLERELTGAGSSSRPSREDERERDDDVDEYGNWASGQSR
jgi:hypothetical protein